MSVLSKESHTLRDTSLVFSQALFTGLSSTQLSFLRSHTRDLVARLI